jgi:hypothetical protein
MIDRCVPDADRVVHAVHAPHTCWRLAKEPDEEKRAERGQRQWSEGSGSGGRQACGSLALSPLAHSRSTRGTLEEHLS